MRYCTLVIAVFAARSLLACSCASLSGFFDGRGALVVDGVVRSYVRSPHLREPPAMDVEVKHVLSGKYAAKTIRIVGDFGMSCVPYVSNFPIGTEWLFAVGGPVEVQEMGDENFTFAPCANAWLAVIGDRASGRFDRMHSGEATLSQIQARLNDPNAAMETRPPFASVPLASTPPRLRGSTTILLKKGCTTLDTTRVDVVVDASGNIRDFGFAPAIPPCLSSSLWTAARQWRFDTHEAARFSVTVTIASQ